MMLEEDMNDREIILRRLADITAGQRVLDDRGCLAWRCRALIEGRVRPEDPDELGQLLAHVLPGLGVSVAA